MKLRSGLTLTDDDQQLLKREFYWEEQAGGVFITVPPPDATPAEIDRRLEEWSREVEAARRDDPLWQTKLHEK